MSMPPRWKALCIIVPFHLWPSFSLYSPMRLSDLDALSSLMVFVTLLHSFSYAPLRILSLVLVPLSTRTRSHDLIRSPAIAFLFLLLCSLLSFFFFLFARFFEICCGKKEVRNIYESNAAESGSDQRISRILRSHIVIRVLIVSTLLSLTTLFQKDITTNPSEPKILKWKISRIPKVLINVSARYGR